MQRNMNLDITILYEIGDINRFDSVQQFASYSRLVKCEAVYTLLRLATNGHANKTPSTATSDIRSDQLCSLIVFRLEQKPEKAS